MPRGPVKFRENPDFVPFHLLPRPPRQPATPAHQRPVLRCPPAPRRPGYHRLLVPPPRPRSPPQYNGFQSPSVSKSGVSKAPINRPLPPPSRIPILSKTFFSKKVSSRPQTRLSDSSEASVSLLPIRCEKKGQSATTSTPPRLAKPARPAIRETAPTSARQRVPAYGGLLVRPGSSEEMPEKRVRFGDVTVHEVGFWIDRQRHVFRDGAYLTGRLQGWRVTPRAEPDEEGETEKYMTMWGHDHSSLFYHDAHKPCTNDGCAWNSLARIKRRWREKGIHGWNRDDIFRTWNRYREKVRERGGFALYISGEKPTFLIAHSFGFAFAFALVLYFLLIAVSLKKILIERASHGPVWPELTNDVTCWHDSVEGWARGSPSGEDLAGTYVW
ncbi:hypothetical protein T310_2290 [Rasamsonia emersonii CBS 393.64]|uniref:Uncharacterized protein n=1 Tax=Rasamsonia emersonii (strain ATCC 16479 / CBS 393.64 / IMI 116815) TaxID=1408163 RepID=A0A0F4YZP2_RASE3|nr:hypothetical protein T310_2290 [Rasamsonia emersonii CBS 393.64]KKA23699.1 hypothetical protein T310_2290 [Rasamsonia emersonii CBS 393.64]